MENTKSVHGFPDWTELKMLFSGKLSLNEEMFIIMRIQKYQPLDAAAEGLKSWLKKHDYKIEGHTSGHNLQKNELLSLRKNKNDS
jgi:hypothetical protein